MRCETCLRAGRQSTYAGETGRNSYSRGKEHMDAFRREDEKNPLWIHCLGEHGGTRAEFGMKVVGRLKKWQFCYLDRFFHSFSYQALPT